MYNELKDRGFRDYFFDTNDTEVKLATGMYCIMKYNFSQIEVCYKAEEAIEAALKPYYGSAWDSKYTIIVIGASTIISRNLEPVE